MTPRHSTRLSQEHDEDPEEQHRTASADYPELGDILTDRPDPGSQITVIGMRRAAEAYDAEHDARNGDYNGGEGDTGMYWAEPGEQQWARDNLGPQEEAPPPLMGQSPVLARLAAIEEAQGFFGMLHHATDINGTHVDDAGDAPEHGTVPRAEDPNAYDDESQEGQGDDRWNQALPKDQGGDKENENAATVGMYPEGISSGNGPGLPIGAFTAAISDEDYAELHHHMAEEHGYSGSSVPNDFWRISLPHRHSQEHFEGSADHYHPEDYEFDPDWEDHGGNGGYHDFIASRHEARVPWTDKERGTLHTWQESPPSSTWGDFVNSADFPLLGPGEHVVHEEPGERLGEAEAALDLPHPHDDDDSEIDQGGVEGDDGFPRVHRDAALNVHVRIDGQELKHDHDDDGPDPQPQQHEHDDPDNSLDNSRTTPDNAPDNPADKNGPEITSGQASGGGLPVTPPVTPPDGRKNPDDPGLSPDDPGHPDNWPQAGADVSETGRAYTQGSDDGKVKRGAPAPGPFSPGDGDSGGGGDQGDDPDDGDQPDDDDTPFSKDAALAMFTAAAGSPAFRFEFTAAWHDVVAKAKRIRAEGHVRITHASAGMVIGEVRGDHDTYESGIQRPVGKRMTIQYWACGCPWASFHQDKAAAARYAGRPCSHVMALQFEAQSRGMFGRSFGADAEAPAWSPQTVVVKSYPPYEGDPHAGQWREQWRAPLAHLAHREGWPYVPPVAPRDLAQHIIGHHGLDAGSVARALTRMGDPAKGDIWARAWHDAEHRNKTEHAFNHQHDAPSGLAGETRWPAAFRPEQGFSVDPYGGTPHRDFPGAERSVSLEPLPPHWSSLAPADRATVALLRAGADPGAVGALRVMAGLRATADQANSSWGSQNVSEHPTQKPYGATSPRNWDMDPGSYGFLSGPDPDNWGGIQDDSAMQMPLTNTAAHQVLVPGAPRPVPGDLHWPAVEGWQPEDQGSFGYTDRANTSGPSTSITPRDPEGIRMEEALASGTPYPFRDTVPQLDGALAELRDEPEPALPSTTGDEEIEATAAADGTIGGGSAATGQGQGAAEDIAALGEFGAARRMYLHHLAGTPMGDLARETWPQAQQPSPVGQEPGMGSGDEYLSPGDPSIQTVGNQQWSGGGADSDETAVPAGQPQGQIDDIVAAFQRSAAARGYAGDSRPAVADGDIAAAARAHLSKTADVLPQAEAEELIREGAGSRARNLDLLRLEGTHYEDADEDLGKRGISLDDYDDDVMFA